MANSFNSSRLSPLTAARCCVFTICRVCCIHKCTQLREHGGTPPRLCSGGCGFPWVGCVVLLGGIHNHGIAGHQEDAWHRLEKVCVSCRWWLLWTSGCIAVGVLQNGQQSPMGALGIAASLYLQASGNRYAVWNGYCSVLDVHAICIQVGFVGFF